MKMSIRLTVNGSPHSLELSEEVPLIFALRNDLDCHGAKLGCGLEQCGACVVLADGEPIYSCTTRIGDLQGKAIETLEGLAAESGELHPIQQAFLNHNAAQCGFCLSGIVIRTKALLAKNPKPSRQDICQALDGHLCRCGAQPRMIRAVESAAARLRGAS
jgi:nicotinate dehydrogenase subunit A